MRLTIKKKAAAFDENAGGAGIDTDGLSQCQIRDITFLL